MAKQEFKPDWATMPGDHLEEYLEERKMTLDELVILTAIPKEILSKILLGQHPVTPGCAQQFEKVFGLKADIWLGFQKRWDEHQKLAGKYGGINFRATMTAILPSGLLVEELIQPGKGLTDALQEGFEAGATAVIEAYQNQAHDPIFNRYVLATRFTLVDQSPEFMGGLHIEWRSKDRWVIVDTPHLYTRKGEWVHEPLNSNRTEEFLAQTRYTLDEAWEIANKLIKKEITG